MIVESTLVCWISFVLSFIDRGTCLIYYPVSGLDSWTLELIETSLTGEEQCEKISLVCVLCMQRERAGDISPALKMRTLSSFLFILINAEC